MNSTHEKRPPAKTYLYGVAAGFALLTVVACGSTEPSGTANPQQTGAAATPTDESVEGDLRKFKTGDCLTIEQNTNKVTVATCTVKGAFKVLLRKDGTIDEKACEQTQYTESLYSDDPAVNSRDLILCIAPVSS